MARIPTSQDASTGGNFVSEEGLYHMMIVSIEEAPTNNKGFEIENAFCRVNMSVLASSVGDKTSQRDKSFKEVFFFPKEASKPKAREFILKKITRLLLATNQITPDQVGQEVDVNAVDMTGHQLCIKIEKDDEGYAGIAFADIYHVDDSDIAKWPKDEEALGMIDQSFRGFKSIPKPKKSDQAPLDMNDDVAF